MCVNTNAHIKTHALHLQESHFWTDARYFAQLVNGARHIAVVLLLKDACHALQVVCFAPIKTDFADAVDELIMRSITERRKRQAVRQSGLEFVHGIGRDGILGLGAEHQAHQSGELSSLLLFLVVLFFAVGS